MSENERVRTSAFCEGETYELTSMIRQKKHRKCNFDLHDAVHGAEYSNVKRPIDPKTKRTLEPAHRFEVNIEGDTVSQAK